MEKSKLNIICGMRVVDVLFAEEDVGIEFENNISLAIYNRHELIGCSMMDAYQLIGNIIVSVSEAADTIAIKFENNFTLQVDMRGESYTGPEAMQLCIPGEPIVIWN
jgi:hypothetical protein